MFDFIERVFRPQPTEFLLPLGQTNLTRDEATRLFYKHVPGDWKLRYKLPSTKEDVSCYTFVPKKERYICYAHTTFSTREVVVHSEDYKPLYYRSSDLHIMLHEIAHVLNDKNEDHGPVWRDTYLRLCDEYQTVAPPRTIPPPFPLILDFVQPIITFTTSVEYKMRSIQIEAERFKTITYTVTMK